MITIGRHFRRGIGRETNLVKQALAQFEQRHGCAPNLEHPRRFSEKLLRRILQDDDPFYRLYGTKLAAPYFLAARRIPGLHFARRLKVVHRLAPEDFDDLPDSFVITSSFGSGLNRIVRSRSEMDRDEVCRQFNERLPAYAGPLDPESNP